MVSTNSLKNGMTLLIDGKLQQIVDFHHLKPGKGGAFVRTKLKNVETGKIIDHTFRAGIDVEQAIVERTTVQYLYREGDDYVLMDNETYEQQHALVAPPWATPPTTSSEGDDGPDLDVRRPHRRRRTARLDGCSRSPHRTGRGRQHRHQRDQAADARDRPGGPGAAVHRAVGERIKVDTRTGAYMSRA